MTTMSILVMVDTWVLGLFELEALGMLIGSLDSSLQIVAHLLCFFFFVFL